MGYIREGLLSEGYLRLRLGGLIFGGGKGGGGEGFIIGIVRYAFQATCQCDNVATTTERSRVATVYVEACIVVSSHCFNKCFTLSGRVFCI